MRDGYKENYCRIKFEQEIINKDILPFLKYEKENLKTSKELLDITNTFWHKYQKRSSIETQTSKDSYISTKYAEFKQGIEEESKNLTVLKYQAGFW